MIRPLHLADASSIAALDARCFARPWSAQSWSEELSRAHSRGFCEEGEQEILAYALCWHLAGEAELLRIAVLPEARGTGRGQRLLAYLIEQARLASCSAMTLEVQCDNQAAIALYRRAGFHSQGRRTGYYAGIDALLMRLDLAHAVA